MATELAALKAEINAIGHTVAVIREVAALKKELALIQQGVEGVKKRHQDELKTAAAKSDVPKQSEVVKKPEPSTNQPDPTPAKQPEAATKKSEPQKSEPAQKQPESTPKQPSFVSQKTSPTPKQPEPSASHKPEPTKQPEPTPKQPLITPTTSATTPAKPVATSNSVPANAKPAAATAKPMVGAATPKPSTSVNKSVAKPAGGKPVAPGQQSALSVEQKAAVDNIKTKVSADKSLDATKLETYISDKDFTLVFEMPREEFQKLPKWKQEAKKKAAGMF